MATEADDPRTFESWEDAFQYPVPTIRGLERKLRGTVEDNREKLRSLVGSSYRDLLGTARTIVDVHDQMQQVESLLAHASKKSDSRIFDKLGTNYVKFERAQAAKDQDRNTRVSQTRVLQASLNTVSQLLRLNGSSLLAAKLLVIARLLQKTLSERVTVESEERKLASLRVKLLSKINRRLQQGGLGPTVLTEDLSALALARSLPPSEVLNHLLNIRRESIGRPLEDSSADVRGHVLTNIKLYFNTLQDSRSIFPDVLKASLRGLGAKPILKDERIQRMDSLNLDIHEQWLRDEVRNYVPWTRSEELTKDKAKELASQWSSSAFTILVDSIKASLGQIDDFETLTNLRRSVLQEWLSQRRSGSATSGSKDVERLSVPFQSRLDQIIKSHCQSFSEDVTKTIEDALQNISTQINDKDTSLWSKDVLALDAANGASAFRKAIINGRLGKTTGIYRILGEVEKGMGTVEKMRTTVKAMQGNRWDDDLEEEEFEGDAATALAKTLSTDQPAELQNVLDDAAQSCWHDIESRLTKSIEDNHLRGVNATLVALTTARIIRELHPPLSSLWAKNDSSTSLSFCKTLFETCLTTITRPIAKESLAVLSKALSSFISANRNIDALWEGKPPLPSQPSPAAFKYLRAVTKSMESIGSDVWAVEAVASLKSTIEITVEREIQQATEKLDASAAETVETEAPQDDPTEIQTTKLDAEDGDNKEEDAPGNGEESAKENLDEARTADKEPPRNIQKREKTLQLLFDTIYLQQACSSKIGDASSHDLEKTPIGRATKKLQAMVGLDEASSSRIHKSASDYWKRTYLLFGLLVSN